MSSTFQFADHPDHQVRPPPSPCSTNENRRGCSKAQACLHKILYIIASSKNPSLSAQSSNGGLGIDLNLRLCGASFGEQKEEEGEEEKAGFVEESGSFNSSSVAAPDVDKRGTVLEKSSEVEGETAKQTDDTNCEQLVLSGERDHDKEEEEEENGNDDSGSEITNVQVKKFEKSHEDRESEMNRSSSDGLLGLLVQAAKLVSREDVGHGEEDEDDETESRERQGQRRELHDSPRTKADATEEPTKTELLASKKKGQVPEAAFGESEVEVPPLPVVRSKRGRSQVLPYRFRDSVLEPWARPSRSNPVPTKRRVGVKP